MLKLTLINGLPILINPEWVVDIVPNDSGGSVLTMIKDSIAVKEDIGTIATLLKRAK